MRHRAFTSFALPIVLCTAALASAAEERERIHHDVTVRLDPAGHGISVRDRIHLPAAMRSTPIRLQFHSDLELTNEEPAWQIREIKATGSGADVGEHASGVSVRTYEATPKDGTDPGDTPIYVSLIGTIHHPLVTEGAEYARSFSRSPGIISDEGVVLSGASYWLPRVGDELFTYRLTLDLPKGWDAVSQGTRTQHNDVQGRRIVTWDCRDPMDDAYIIAARFTEYERQAGSVTAMAFLRTPDANLANKYLEATAQYIDMYGRLLGPYPFEKFALVENFWETGYGMPSFTLLGPKIIRFPFILHSSYPHEILHNWWGNSVYVDWRSGNWCEGLTAYLADHLIKEGQGRGVEYRRDTLKGYGSFVGEGRDFPLTEFTSRHSGATQAIGYGKCLMVFHMLRRRFGDDIFARALHRFYREQRFRTASWTDIEATFSSITGEDLRSFFAQWVGRPGAPELAVAATLDDDGTLRVSLRQTQDGDAFELLVPLVVTRSTGDTITVTPRLEGRDTEVLINDAKAVRIDVDPRFDVFRRLDTAETPPTLAEMFGAAKVTLVVPDEETPLAAAWSGLADAWSAGNETDVAIVTASALTKLPADRAVWILGTENPWRSVVGESLAAHGARVDRDSIRFGAESVPLTGHSAVWVARHPTDPSLAIGWVGTDSAAAVPGLARKLPHYGKYSFLAFAGDAPDNVVKGTWPPTGSPLTAFVGDGRESRPPMGRVAKRAPLASLAPVFDPSQLRADVTFLADDAQEGRGVGTPGHDRAAEYIAKAFKAAGLRSTHPAGRWFDTWTEAEGPRGERVTLRNVIGMIPGTDPELAGQSVVVAAHYDHLGRGWPDAREGQAGKIHNGADDNASGVAVLLDVARILGRELKPARTIIFVAFDGEEWGLKGARRYVESMKQWPISRVHSMVNLDSVGRLGANKLLVLGSGTATEWPHVAMGVGFTTGVESTCVADDPGGSDQVVFHEHGVPAVQLFTGPHEDYHRSTDTADRVDFDGLVKVATWLRETLVYLSGRTEPFTSALAATPGGAERPAKRPPAGRRVSLGTVPDFAYQGGGVRVGSVIAGSPAEKAGIVANDVILAVNGVEMTDLRGYGAALRTRSPGDVITVRVQRGDETLELTATLVAR